MTKKHPDIPPLSIETISNGILVIRGQDVETKVLKQAVRRNIDRFPEDFMFQLTNQEYMRLRSQIVTSTRMLYIGQ